MASTFKKNYVLADPASSSAWQLLCSWDFSITNERAVKQRKSSNNNFWEFIYRFGVYLGSWLLSTSLAVGCAASIYFLYATNWSLLQEAETLLVPFVVSLMNMVIPLFYSLFNKFEHYSTPILPFFPYTCRNVLLRMFILGVLCYYWMNEVSFHVFPQCWESMVGQALYRLVIVDFLFLMLGSFFGEFLSK
uniref:Transmembrane channel-like protein n=1 Tax=Sphaeramia orbicularis TaxID=375764 RepID=A0A673CEK5_9TELE